MSTRSRSTRRFLPSSPFNNREPDPEVERFEVQDRVTHDTYGLGRVVQVEDEAVTIDFDSHKIRVNSPYSKLTKI